MAMVCPQCHKSFDRLSQCPGCGVALMFHANLAGGPNELTEESSVSWQQTPWGRMVGGVILAQGLAHSLYFLLSGAFQIGTAFDSQLSEATFGGLVLWHVVQGFSLIIGGMICGAGRRRGFAYGSLVGLANSLIFITIQYVRYGTLHETILFQPIIHMGFGAIGGFLGWLIWKPLPLIEFAGGAKQTIKRSSALSWKFLSGPIHWIRVFAGTGLVVCGVVWANSILEFIVDASEGGLRLDSHMQAHLISLEISALAAILGGALAGATTFNGLKQGLVVGFFGSMVLMGFLFSRPDTTFEAIVMNLLGIFILATGGGWFGGQLFPPVLSSKSQRYLPTS